MKKFLQGLSRKQFNKSHSSSEDLLYETGTFLEHILSTIEDAIFIADDDYKFVYVNEAACKLYGFSSKQILQMQIKDIDAGLSQEKVSKNWELLKEKKILSFGTIHKDIEGKLYPVKITNYYLEYNHRAYNLGIVKDERYITNLLNAQNDFIILTDGNDIISANIQLFEFFNYKNIDEFKKEHHCVCEFFIEEDGYMPNHVDWMKDVRDSVHNKFKVKMKNMNTNKVHSFALSATPFDKERSLITLEDVTELEHYKNKLELLAITDEMTSLYNRRYFNRVFTQEINRAQRSSQKLGFIMFDIDFFKQYNDTYGHLMETVHL